MIQCQQSASLHDQLNDGWRKCTIPFKKKNHKMASEDDSRPFIGAWREQGSVLDAVHACPWLVLAPGLA